MDEAKEMIDICEVGLVCWIVEHGVVICDLFESLIQLVDNVVLCFVVLCRVELLLFLLLVLFMFFSQQLHILFNLIALCYRRYLLDEIIQSDQYSLFYFFMHHCLPELE